MNSLVEKFQEYSTWRFELTRQIEGYRAWLQKTQLGDERDHQAIVAEFSRGKSELINARPTRALPG